MHSLFINKRLRRIEKRSLTFLILSITSLSLLDLFYNLLAFDKGTLFTYLWVILIVILIYSSYKLLIDFKFESKYFKYTFFLFLSYEFIIVFRGWSFSNSSLTSFLRVPYIFWPFIIPLFVFFDKRLSTLSFLMKCFHLLGLIFLIINLCFPRLLLFRISAETIIFTLALGSGFLLMNSNYLSNRKINISFLIILLSTLSLIYVARRTGLVLLIGFIISSYFLNIWNKHKPLLFKLFPLIITISLFILFSFDEFSRTLAKNLNERIFEDTRSGVIEMFFIDMSDFILFGKGMNGTYFCPIGGGLQENGIDYLKIFYRDTIENGYLQLMLSGGVIHIILFLLVLLPSAFMGIFKSCNKFTKACGIMILLWLLYMFGFGQPALSLGYILVWICIGICYKKSIRYKNDEEIKKAFYI